MRDDIRCLSDGEIELVAGASGIEDGTSNTLMIVARTERHNAAAQLEAALAVEIELER